MGEIEEKGGRKGAQMKLAPRTWLRVHGVRVYLYMTGGAWGVCGVCVFLERRERRAHQVSSFLYSIPAGTPAKKVLYLTPGREITAGAGVCRHCHLRHWQWRRYSSSSGAPGMWF